MNQTKTPDVRAYLALEHARLHIVTAWPESTRKQVLLAAIRSSIHRLMQVESTASFVCLMCRLEPKTLLAFSTRRQPITAVQREAA